MQEMIKPFEKMRSERKKQEIFIYLFEFNVCNLRPVLILQRATTRQEKIREKKQEKKKNSK